MLTDELVMYHSVGVVMLTDEWVVYHSVDVVMLTDEWVMYHSVGVVRAYRGSRGPSSGAVTRVIVPIARLSLYPLHSLTAALTLHLVLETGSRKGLVGCTNENVGFKK